VFSGAIWGSAGKRWACVDLRPEVTGLKDAAGTIECFGMARINFSDIAGLSPIFPPAGTSCAEYEASPNCLANQVYLNAETGLGDTDSDMVESRWDFVSAGVDTYIDLDGEWSVSLDADLMYEEYPHSSNNADEFPGYGGTATADMVHGSLGRFFLRARVGGSLTVSATCGPCSVSASDVITSLNQFDVTVPVCNLSGMCRSVDTTNGMGISAEWQGQANVGNAGYSHSYGSGSVTADSGINLSTGDDETAECDFSGAVARSWTKEVVARALEHTYPSSLTLKVAAKAGVTETHSFSGSVSLSGTQKQWSVGSSINGDTKSDSVAEFGPVSCWLDTGRLSELGEDTGMWRVLQRGFPYAALTLSHAASYAHTLTSASQTGPSDLVKTLSPALYLQTYRYLRVRVKASTGGSAFSVKIGSKEWTKDRFGAALSAGTSYAWFELDLCSPTNATEASDTTDTIWPTPTVDGVYWGVTKISEFRLTGLAGGVTYDLAANGLELKRVEPTDGVCTRSEWCPAWPGWIQSHEAEISGDTTTTVYYRRFVLGVSNGRQALELVDMVKTVTSSTLGGTTTTYSIRPISALKGDVETLDSGEMVWPGWSVAYASGVDTVDGAAGSEVLHGWLNRNRPMVWLFGGGALYRDGAWDYGFHVDTDDAPTIYAQSLVDCVEWIGGTGDVFGHASSPTTEGAIDLRAAVILRGGGHGIVLGSDDLPASTKLVTVREVGGSGATFGTGTSDDQGRYRTGLNYAPGFKSAEAQAEGGASAAIVALQPRKRTRAALTVAAAVAYRCLAVDSPRAWLHVGEGKRIKTYHINAWALAFESAEYAIDEWRRLRCDPRRGCLVMVGKRGASFKVFVSDDGGLTASEVLSVTATSMVVEIESERGLQVVLWENGGAVQRQESTDGGATWSSASAVSYAGGNLTGTLRDIARDARNGNLVLVVESMVLESFDSGASWALRLS
jgi:hypothetical protein